MQTTDTELHASIAEAMRRHGPDSIHEIARQADATPFEVMDFLAEHMGHVECDGNGSWGLSGEPPKEIVLRVAVTLGTGRIFDLLSYDGHTWADCGGKVLTGSTSLDLLAESALR